MEQEQKEPEVTRTIRVPMPTFPPTAMVYSVNKIPAAEETRAPTQDRTVPTSLIAKVLAQPDKKTRPRNYICCQCIRDVVFHDKDIQVNLLQEYNNGYGSFGGLRVHRPRLNSTETEIN